MSRQKKGTLYLSPEDVTALQDAATELGIIAKGGSNAGRTGSASGLIQIIVEALHNDRQQTLALLRAIQTIAAKDQDYQVEVPPEPP